MSNSAELTQPSGDVHWAQLVNWKDVHNINGESRTCFTIAAKIKSLVFEDVGDGTTSDKLATSAILLSKFCLWDGYYTSLMHPTS